MTDQYWYSDDLRINLMIKHNDPRTGSAILTVAQVERTKPDPARFEIPSNYKRVGSPKKTQEPVRETKAGHPGGDSGFPASF